MLLNFRSGQTTAVHTKETKMADRLISAHCEKKSDILYFCQ